jgi:hypothetical protein
MIKVVWLAMSLVILFLGNAWATGTFPIANAGPDQLAVPGYRVTLDGSGSTGSNLHYNWQFSKKPDGSHVKLSSPGVASPSFSPDKPGNYVLTLNVTSGRLNSSDTVQIKALPAQITWNTNQLLTEDVVIPFGQTLTVAPGIVIDGNGHSIQVWGTLNAIGNSSSRIVINDVKIKPGISNLGKPYAINIQFAQINGGTLYDPTGEAIYGNLILRDSIVKNTDEGAYIYLWYPTANCYIERNIFVNAYGLSVGTSGGVKVFVTNNVFYNQKNIYSNDAAVSVWANYDNADSVIVAYNSFISTEKVALEYPDGYTTVNMTAINNFWNTADTSVIDGMIHDQNDNPTSGGIITYAPFLSTPDSNTPDPTAYLP